MRMTFFAIASAVVLLAISPASAQVCDEEVILETFDGTIVMYHQEALFNCCAYLEIEVVQDAFEVGIFEWESFETTPCYCLCCFYVEAAIAGLPPGDYNVSLWKVHDNLNGTWTHDLVGTWTITVSGYSAQAVDVWYQPCIDTAISSEPGSWGTIKALYR